MSADPWGYWPNSDRRGFPDRRNERYPTYDAQPYFGSLPDSSLILKGMNDQLLGRQRSEWNRALYSDFKDWALSCLGYSSQQYCDYGLRVWQYESSGGDPGFREVCTNPEPPHVTTRVHKRVG